MKKYKINCPQCYLKKDVLQLSCPSVCPSCGGFLSSFSVIESAAQKMGVKTISNSLISVTNGTGIYADGVCNIQSENNTFLGAETAVIAKNRARIKMNSDVVNRNPDLPESMNINGFEISPISTLFFKKIIIEVIGLERVINMSESELISYFKVVQNEGLDEIAIVAIRELINPTDISHIVQVIGSDDKLTQDGAKLIKKIAMKLN